MNKKEYSIVINGLTKSIKDATTLKTVLDALDASASKASTSTAAASTAAPAAASGGAKSSSGSSSKAKALTDEEKAAKRLADTQKRLNQVDSEANRAQIAATQALRERTREITREIAINELAEGSINEMGMTLTNLRNEYYDLSEAERENIDVGGQMLTKIQALDAEYKALKESAGDFRDSVGNYEKALGGLEKLDKGLGDLDSNINNVGAAFGGSTQMMSIFGGVTSGVTEIQGHLAKITALVTLAQQINTAVTGENSIMKGVNAAVTRVQTVQENARTIATNLSTKSTIAATVAQRIFNLVAAANPYVILALALVAVIGALIAFSGSTEDAAEDQKQLNAEQKTWMDFLEAEVALLKQTSDARIAMLERQLQLSAVNDKNLKATRKLEDEIWREKLLQNARLMGTYRQEVEALETNRTKLMVYLEMIRDLRLAEARGDQSIALDIDLNGKAEKVDVKEAIDIVQQNVDNTNRAIEIAIKLKSDAKDLENDAKVAAQQRAKDDAEAAKKAAEEAKKKREEAKKLALDRAAVELKAARDLEDVKAEIAGETLEEQYRIIKRSYNRQIEDLKIRLKTEENLSNKSRKYINDQIVALGKVSAKELAELDLEIQARSLETARLREDQETALIKGGTDRRLAEINFLYDRQIDDVTKRLNTEKNLTEQQRKDLNAMLQNYAEQQTRDQDAIILDSLNRNAALELQTADNTLKEIQVRVGEAVKRNEGGILKGVLDPVATKAALETIKVALSDYIVNLREYQTQLTIAHEETLTGMKEGSVEYKEEVQKFAAANTEVNSKIKESQKGLKENTKMTTQVMAEYYKDLFAKVSEYADMGAQAVTAVTDTLSMGIEAALEGLNEQLETTDAAYEEAKAKREKYAENVESIEERLQSASGATADALRDQLQNAMHQREEAAREEARQAKEKAKLEAEIAKKEKQQKKAELIGKIAMGVANTAQGITAALALGPIVGIVMAAIVGAMGAAQVLIMGRQLSKLAKGGPIVGPSHDNGGVNIVIGGKPSYEAQGGEFMVNDKSYAANKTLTEFINASPNMVTAADLVGIVPGFDNVPVTDIATSADDRVIEALGDLEFSPVVSVTDILDVTKTVTTVKDLAGAG